MINELKKLNEFKSKDIDSVGIFVICIGFRLRADNAKHEQVLSKHGVQTSDTDKVHDYHLTFDGQMVCMNELLLDLTSDPFFKCVLIHQYDLRMAAKSEEINLEHLRPYEKDDTKVQLSLSQLKQA